MAKAKKAAKKSTAKKSGGEPARIKPIGDKFTKSSLARHISDETGVDGRSVKAVLASLEGSIYGSMHKKGSGVFTLPGCIKITSTPVAAKPRRQGKDPFTGEMRWFEAKPATVRVRARPLKKLKDAAK
jgi:nucleoid DNA-binding protein